MTDPERPPVDPDMNYAMRDEMLAVVQEFYRPERPPVEPLREAARCRQVAGRCEKDEGHDGDHYTAYTDGVWVHRLASPAAPRPEGLDVELLVNALAATEGVTGWGTRARAIAAEYARLAATSD